MRLYHGSTGQRQGAPHGARLTLVVTSALLGTSASITAIAANSLQVSLPTPPAPSEDHVPAARYRYDRKRTPSANAATRQALVKKVQLWTRKLKALDQGAQKRPEESIASVAGPAAPSREEIASRVAAWSQQLSVFDIESICGPVDNSQDVELYDGSLGPTITFVEGVQPATVQIQWNDNLASLFSGPGDKPGNVSGVRWCTGTLIDPSHVVTAGHCFAPSAIGWKTPSRGAPGGAVPLAAAELAPLMHVNFNYQLSASSHALRAATVYPIARLVEYALNHIDYAIIELGPDDQGKAAGEHFIPLPLDASDDELSQASMITLVQHPNGQPKKVSAGSKISVSATEITYSDVDTLGGSSGAGIVDQNGKLIGVHTNGGCQADGGGFNSGIPLAEIRTVSSIIK